MDVDKHTELLMDIRERVVRIETRQDDMLKAPDGILPKLSTIQDETVKRVSDLEKIRVRLYGIATGMAILATALFRLFVAYVWHR